MKSLFSPTPSLTSKASIIAVTLTRIRSALVAGLVMLPAVFAVSATHAESALQALVGEKAPDAAAPEVRCQPAGTLYQFCQTGRDYLYVPVDENTRNQMGPNSLALNMPPEQVGIISALPTGDTLNEHFATSIFVFDGSFAYTDEEVRQHWGQASKNTDSRQFTNFETRFVDGPADRTFYKSYFIETPSRNPDFQPRPIHVEVIMTQVLDTETDALIVIESQFFDAAAMRMTRTAEPGETLADFTNDFETQMAVHAGLVANMKRSEQ